MALNQTIEVQQCQDEDIPQFFTTMSKGFEHDAPFVDIYFPSHDTETGRAKGSKRLLAWKSASVPDTTFLKAVLKMPGSSAEEIIGIAIWTYVKEPQPDDITTFEDVKQIWPDEDDAAYIRQLWLRYVRYRNAVVVQSDGAGIYVLELLSVDKQYHRQGAGSALVEWGTRQADERGLEAVVEGTPAGLRTYVKAGFEVEVPHMDLYVEEFADRREPELAFLRREARKVQR